MIGALEGTGVALVKLALDAAALRHQAIAHNLANLHSENYVPLGVSFDAQLAAARRGAQPARPQIEQEAWRGMGPRPQDLDLEMVRLSENTVHYQALVRVLGRQMAILGAAIGDARRG